LSRCGALKRFGLLLRFFGRHIFPLLVNHGMSLTDPIETNERTENIGTPNKANGMKLVAWFFFQPFEHFPAKVEKGAQVVESF
jgi:hypothetical protein